MTPLLFCHGRMLLRFTVLAIIVAFCITISPIKWCLGYEVADESLEQGEYLIKGEREMAMEMGENTICNLIQPVEVQTETAKSPSYRLVEY